MQAGKLRHRIAIQRPNRSQGTTFGDAKIESWTTIATVWAAIEPISSREALKADHVMSGITHRIRMRGQSNLAVTSDMRVQFGTRIFQIEMPPINKDERGIELELMCTEQVS